MQTNRTNWYPWNDAESAARQDPVAHVLHLGLFAICEHLAEIAAILKDRNE